MFQEIKMFVPQNTSILLFLPGEHRKTSKYTHARTHFHAVYGRNKKNPLLPYVAAGKKGETDVVWSTFSLLLLLCYTSSQSDALKNPEKRLLKKTV